MLLQVIAKSAARQDYYGGEGRLWGTHDITIPVSAIGKIEAEDVQLNLKKSEIEALSSIPVKHWMLFTQ